MRTWFVTGATRGLGLETVRAALAAGDRVVATGRDVARLGESLDGAGDRLLALPLDVTEDAAVDAAVALAADRFGGIDILVNNAGYGQLGAFEETSPEATERQFETNVFGVFRVTRAVLPHMRARRSGRIFNISSMVGIVGVDGGSVYAASKFAVTGWSESLGKELARFGIFVTSVHPGYFRTDFLDGSSMKGADLSVADYAESSAAAAGRRSSYNHNQAGDPAAFGRAMVALADAAEPPAMFAAGSDAVAVVAGKAEAMRETVAAWRDLSVSTDFPRKP
jgi:NAD(P)-dependent dehydrogenase (short-subunit alcohol dehydrogenase family)